MDALAQATSLFRYLPTKARAVESLFIDMYSHHASSSLRLPVVTWVEGAWREVQGLRQDVGNNRKDHQSADDGHDEEDIATNSLADQILKQSSS